MVNDDVQARILSAIANDRSPPMIDLDRRVGIIWSPKSGSAAAALWFFSAIGRHDEMMACSQWPHIYRNKYFNDMGGPKAVFDALRDHEFKWIRIIRDPYLRAISMYRHALTYGLLNDTMTEFLNRDIQNEAGYSFKEMLQFLSTTKVNSIDPHFELQLRALDLVAPIFKVINVDRERMYEELMKIEDQLGLLSTNLPNMIANSAPMKNHIAKIDRHIPHAYEMPFAVTHYFTGWPDSQSFLCDETRRMIEKIYEADFNHFRTFF